MTATRRSFRISLLASASVYAIIAIVIALVVIPAVRSDAYALATPDRAAAGFLITLLLFLVVAVVLLLIFRRVGGSGMKGGLIALGILALLPTFALFDAARAYEGHGSAMQTVDTVLFVCVGLGLLASILVITTAFIFREDAKVEKDRHAS